MFRNPARTIAGPCLCALAVVQLLATPIFGDEPSVAIEFGFGRETKAVFGRAWTEAELTGIESSITRRIVDNMAEDYAPLWRFTGPSDDPAFKMQFVVKGDDESGMVVLTWVDGAGQRHKKRADWIGPGTTAAAGIPAPEEAINGLWKTIYREILIDLDVAIQEMLAANVALVAARAKPSVENLTDNRIVLPLDMSLYSMLRTAEFVVKFYTRDGARGPELRCEGTGQESAYQPVEAQKPYGGIVAETVSYRRSRRDEFKPFNDDVRQELLTMETMRVYLLR